MDENQFPSGTVPPQGPVPQVQTARPPRRFGTGLAIGVGIGAGALVVILVILAAVVYLVLMRPTMVDFGRSWPEEVKTVQVEGPWLDLTEGGRGTVTGWSDGGFGSGDGLPGGAFAAFSMGAPTEQNGVLARVSVDIYVTRDTQLLMGGQPWTPQATGNSDPIDAVFGEFQGEIGYDYLDMRELKVTFRVEGSYLIAESIDASATQEDSPFMWGGGF